MSNLRVIHMTYDEFYNKKYVDHIPCLMLFQEDERRNLRFVIGATSKDDANFYDYGFAISCGNYYGPNGLISKDKFLDIIKSDYPEWFDWLLFNPGWF